MISTKLTINGLKEILENRLKLQAEYRLKKQGGWIIGDVISASFKGKRDHERQNMIWHALEKDLGKEAASQVGMLLAYTPEEWNLGEDEIPIATPAVYVVRRLNGHLASYIRARRASEAETAHLPRHDRDDLFVKFRDDEPEMLLPASISTEKELTKRLGTYNCAWLEAGNASTERAWHIGVRKLAELQKLGNKG